MEIRTMNGNVLNIDENRWIISSNATCQLVGEDKDHYEIQNDNNLRAKLPKSIMQENQLSFVEGSVTLPQGVYNQWVVKPERKRSKEKFEKLFKKHRELIFKHQEVVLNKPEFYLLRPDLLSSGGAYIGGFSYSLGELFDSFKSGQHFYFDELAGYKKMYLISTSGSPLSGKHGSFFWCAETSKIVTFNPNYGNSLPPPFIETLQRFKAMFLKDHLPGIDFQDQALEALIEELGGFDTSSLSFWSKIKNKWQGR